MSINIGHCKKCQWRNQETGNCENEKITEDHYHTFRDEKYADHLIYSYDEGGAFWVGEKFGCIHWEANEF